MVVQKRVTTCDQNLWWTFLCGVLHFPPCDHIYIYILRNRSYALKTILKGGKIPLDWKHSDNSSNKSKENKEQLQTRKGVLLR